VTDPRQRLATLRELCRSDVPLSVGTPGDPSFRALLWSVDETAEVMHFSVPPEVPQGQLDALADNADLWAAGYLHEAKVQFDLRGLNLGGSGRLRVLHAQPPRQMLHLPRRRAVRVRRADALAPMASFQHPLASDLLQRLRVADISMTGCALWKPQDVLPLAPGTHLVQVQLDLDAATRFVADLQVQHVSAGPGGASGGSAGRRLRVGCAWRSLAAGAADTLQAWIARGRRRRDLVSLSLD
jgi:c-di-GMP-binding flagellar brake protein YcgR